jgi:4-hydroxybenzoate polyprenyltransferase
MERWHPLTSSTVRNKERVTFQKNPSLRSKKKLTNRVLALIDLVRPFTLLLPICAGIVGAFIAFNAQYPNNPLPFLFINNQYPFLQTRDGFFTLLEGVTALAFVFAGCNSLNAVYDIAEDRINKKDLPIPSGLLTTDDAYTFAWIAYLIGLFRSFFINRTFSLLLLIIIIISVLYSIPPIRLKKRLLISNFIIALSHGLLLFVAAWTIFGDLLDPTPWIIGTVLAVYIFGTITTKDFADEKGDSAQGIKTLPVVLGSKRAAYVTAPFFLVPFIVVIFFTEIELLKGASIYLLSLSLWAIYGAYELRPKAQNNIGIYGNIMAWTHMYLLLLAMIIGFAVVYLYL